MPRRDLIRAAREVGKRISADSGGVRDGVVTAVDEERRLVRLRRPGAPTDDGAWYRVGGPLPKPGAEVVSVGHVVLPASQLLQDLRTWDALIDDDVLMTNLGINQGSGKLAWFTGSDTAGMPLVKVIRDGKTEWAAVPGHFPLTNTPCLVAQPDIRYMPDVSPTIIPKYVVVDVLHPIWPQELQLQTVFWATSGTPGTWQTVTSGDTDLATDIMAKTALHLQTVFVEIYFSGGASLAQMGGFEVLIKARPHSPSGTDEIIYPKGNDGILPPLSAPSWLPANLTTGGVVLTFSTSYGLLFIDHLRTNCYMSWQLSVEQPCTGEIMVTPYLQFAPSPLIAGQAGGAA